jgi:hypothetical protein
VTSAPIRLSADTARLSSLVIFTRVARPIGAVGTAATDVSLAQRAIGGGAGRRPTVTPSTPTWPQGATATARPATRTPLSRSYQPVQPDSVNGLPPLPVRIASGRGPPAP